MKVTKFSKIIRDVTGGPGGMSLLVKGAEKNLLHDCGMACFHEELITNIEREIGEGVLDYIALSHSHYDHMGALPYLLERWPDVQVCASEKTAEVFGRPGAVSMIESMGKSAAEFYGKNPDDVKASNLRVDIVLENGDVINLGDEKLLCFETRGHTDCSMSFLLQPQGILFASESTGVMETSDRIHTSVLKSFDDSIESAEFLKVLPWKEIIVPHYGFLEDEVKGKFLGMYIEAAIQEQALLRKWIDEGLSPEEMLKEHKKRYWNDKRAENQPFRAYKMNTEITIKMMIKDMKQSKS